MKIDASRLALALGGTTAVLWIVCSLLVALFPGSMMSMTGSMLHADPPSFGWSLTLDGFFMGLVCWTVWAMAAGWMIGGIYNRLQQPGTS